MINLNEICYSPLNDFALRHFSNLNPVDASGNLTSDSLIVKILDFKDSLVDDDEINIVEFILGSNFTQIKKILIGTPDILNNIVDEFENQFDYNIIYNTNGDSASLTTFGVELKNIFDYESYRSTDFCVETLHNLGYNLSKPCPYCNIDTIEVIHYTDNISNMDKEQALLDLDHFYPRSRFPFLALSFFNLVPSCSKCNSREKRQMDFRITSHFNPFITALDDYYEFKTDVPIIPNMDSDTFDILYTAKQHDGGFFPDDSIKSLKIVERLRSKKGDIVRFVNVISCFNDGDNSANVLFDQTGIPRYTIEDALFGFGITNNRNDIHNKELTKVLRDIFNNIS